MPDNNTVNNDKYVRLPIFKDKVMYISKNESSYKMEQSYVVSASYKGILRLSPNNYNTIYETNPIELTVEQDQALSSSYSDAIVFEDDAIIEEGEETEAKKVNADIRYRMIIGSDSDGYLVNFRMSDESVEFDKLGVIGITKTSSLIIYSDSQSSDPFAFTLGNTIMPSLPNELPSNRAEITTELSKISGNTKLNPEEWDEIEIDVTGDGDKSYLLYGHPNTDKKRVFDYKRSQQFIRDIIMETLLSIQSVPTGSIHWLPVTYAQYKKLVNDSRQFPNHYFRKSTDGAANTKNPADPIIRDYLLCDGRKYKSSQFPELAKILWGEKITYWDINGIMKTHTNGGKKVVGEGENKKTEYDDYFRVPDLRTKFISYVYAKGVEDALYFEPDQIYKFKSDAYGSNVTGTYTPDNSPRYPNGLNGGEHFHFLAYGSYNGYNLHAQRINDMYNFKGYTFATDLSLTSLSPRIWYLQNTTGDISDKGESSSDSGNSNPGWGYGFGSAGGRRRSVSSRDIIVAPAFVSAPQGGFNSFKIQPSLGKTSNPKTTYIIPINNKESYKVTEYETFDFYQPLESGISKNNLVSRYGHENAPKFYTFLPLIKI